MTDPDASKHDELLRLRAEADAREHAVDDLTEDNRRHSALIARLQREARVRAEHLDDLSRRMQAAEDELNDLRGVRDALTPPELPLRPGMSLAAVFVPAAERVSGDFYVVTKGPEDSTVIAIGDVVGHGLEAARRAAFVRTAIAATAPFSDSPCQLLSWANTALVERAGVGTEFVTAACVTYRPADRCMRWAYAGHPPAISVPWGRELAAPDRSFPLGLHPDLACSEGALEMGADASFLLYTDGLTEARRGGEFFGVEGVADVLRALRSPSPGEVVESLRSSVCDFSDGELRDDLCLLAACVS